MKRIIAGLALGAAATLVTVAPAQAAPVNPVKAVNKQFSPGHGVRISETNRTFKDGKAGIITRITGSLEFGESGVVASDLSKRFKPAKGMDKSEAKLFATLGPTRILSLGGYSYAQGGVYGTNLPEDRKWVRFPAESGSGVSQMIDIFDAKLLKTLVAKAKHVKGDYRGAISLKELAGLTSGEKVDGHLAKIQVKYLLDTDSRGLVSRVVSEWTMDFGVLGTSKSVTESRFTGWGAKIKIKAPPESQWVDFEDLDADALQDMPENSIDLLGQNR